jgi:hypothetical protein
VLEWLETGFELITRFIAHFDTAHDYTLLFTITHTLVSTVTSWMPLLDSSFERRTLSFLWVPERSPVSDTRFYNSKKLTTTEPQQFTKFKVKVMLRSTVRWQVCLGVKPHERLKARYFTVSCGFVDVGRPLWREGGFVVYNFCWPSSAPSRARAPPYCLRF